MAPDALHDRLCAVPDAPDTHDAQVYIERSLEGANLAAPIPSRADREFKCHRDEAVAWLHRGGLQRAPHPSPRHRGKVGPHLVADAGRPRPSAPVREISRMAPSVASWARALPSCASIGSSRPIRPPITRNRAQGGAHRVACGGRAGCIAPSPGLDVRPGLRLPVAGLLPLITATR